MEKMQKMQSRKSSSWWWDSHISPKNFKWLSENLEEMETQVKETLELIEEGESSAEKAEVLIAHVHNFHQMYRDLAERYGNVTGELRKNIPSSLRSHASISVSESDSEAQSPMSPEPDLQKKMLQQKPKPQSDCFDVSIGSGVSSDVSKKGSDGSSSSSESDSELDEVKEENSNNILYALSQKIIELEDELHEARAKLEALEEKNMRCLCNFGVNSEVSENEEKLQVSVVHTSKLEKDLDEVKSEKEALEAVILVNKNEIDRLKDSMISAAKQFEVELACRDTEIDKCKQEFGVLSEKYQHDISTLEAEIDKLLGVIEKFEGDLAKISQEKLLLESRVEGLVKLQEAMKDTQKELEKVSAEKEVLRERALEFEQLFRDLEISGMEVANLPETIKNLKAQIEGTLQEKSILQDRIKELEQVLCDSLQKHSLDKSSLSADLSKLSEANASLEVKLASMEAELKQVYVEKAAESINSEKQISGLNQDLVDVKNKLELLLSEKSLVDNKVITLLAEITTRDEKMKQMDDHLNQLQLEHAKLMSQADLTRKSLSELHVRVSELEEEVEMQKLVISENAEGKREAIRQLCFSLEHYRSGYQELWELLHGRKRPLVMAT